MRWRCPEGDFEARIGDYLQQLWPPRPDEEPHRIAPMLADRLGRRQVTGIRQFGVEQRDGDWVAKVTLAPGGDEHIVRDAAAPIPVEFDAKRPEAMRTVRLRRAATGPEPSHRALTRQGVAMTLAALRGRLRRAGIDDDCDFLVDDTRVRLAPNHQIGPPGGPLILDAAGHPFAQEGDDVCCVGGSPVRGPVRDRRPVFSAGELRVYE